MEGENVQGSIFYIKEVQDDTDRETGAQLAVIRRKALDAWWEACKAKVETARNVQRKASVDYGNVYKLSQVIDAGRRDALPEGPLPNMRDRGAAAW